MASTDFETSEIFDGAGLEIKAKILATRRSTVIDGDFSNNPPQALKIDLIERFSLKEIKMEKLAWGSYIKAYIISLKEKLDEGRKFARLASFKEGATQLAKHIMKMYSKVTIYQGRSEDPESGYTYLVWKEEEEVKQPYFLYFLDGLTTDELVIIKKPKPLIPAL